MDLNERESAPGNEFKGGEGGGAPQGTCATGPLEAKAGGPSVSVLRAALAGLLRRRLFGSLTYSLQGLKACWVHEEAFRVEVVFSLFLVPLGLWLGETGVEKVLLVGAVLLVMIVELLNSAVESAIDRIGTERAELSGRAKDQGSAAVLLAIVTLVVVWVLVAPR